MLNQTETQSAPEKISNLLYIKIMSKRLIKLMNFKWRFKWQRISENILLSLALKKRYDCGLVQEIKLTDENNKSKSMGSGQKWIARNQSIESKIRDFNMNSNKDQIVWAVFIYIDFKARDYYSTLTIVSFLSFMYPRNIKYISNKCPVLRKSSFRTIHFPFASYPTV